MRNFWQFQENVGIAFWRVRLWVGGRIELLRRYREYLDN
jgi:hypothetical protein